LTTVTKSKGTQGGHFAKNSDWKFRQIVSDVIDLSEDPEKNDYRGGGLQKYPARRTSSN
jgi:hypothetical protein